MPVIIPALLDETRDGFDDRIFVAERLFGVERIQVDFCDGNFVPFITVPVKDLDTLNPAFHFEAHLMVREPQNFLDYEIAGFKTIILHYEAFAKEEQLDAAASEIAKLGMTPAIAINPETPVSVLRYFGDTVTHFVLLSVHPGAQGQSFMPETPARVAELRQLLPHATIEVDGGINSTNARSLLDAGADLLAVGSALFKAPDPAVAYSEIETKCLT